MSNPQGSPDPDSTACDLAIVGGGAAGLMAGIFAGQTCQVHHRGHPTFPLPRIVILDTAKTLGAKILVSGGGRCNVTHERVLPSDFAGSDRRRIAQVLKTFQVSTTVDFFRQLGVALKTEETGKLFPVTDQARTVLEALLGTVRAAGVQILNEHRVQSVHPSPSVFQLETSKGKLSASRVILAAGGQSLPKTGSDGSGYTLARALGHRIRAPWPALVPLVLDSSFFHARLSGLTQEVELTLRAPSGRILHRQAGSLLWTHTGISGPAVLDISRHWIAAKREDAGVRLCANFLPGMDAQKLETSWFEAARAQPQQIAAGFLRPLLPRRLTEELFMLTGNRADEGLSSMSRAKRRALLEAITCLTLPVVGDRGFTHAEATAGGVPLEQVDPRTMESKIQPNLWLCGELLDVDGRVGGYNFQWAWCSGRLAGLHAGMSLMDPDRPGAHATHTIPR